MNRWLQNNLRRTLEIFYHSEYLQAADGPRQRTLREAAMRGTMLVAEDKLAVMNGRGLTLMSERE